MQMHIPHSLVVLVVSLGLFASATPQFGVPQACPFEQVVVPVDVVNTCPQPEVVSIKTIYKTVTELVPNSGCTDDFTDFANVQRIADTACRNGLVFTGLDTRRLGVFERQPACQSYSIVQRPQGGSLKRRDGFGGLSDIIHGKFEAYSDNFRHNIDQNINNNGNIDEEDTKETSAGGRGFGGFGGFKKTKRSPQWGYGGYGGYGGGGGGGAFDDNDNQNINQNVNANQNLMANLGRFNSFFGEGRHSRGGCDGASGVATHGLNGLGFGINENTDFNVNNNVAFEDTGFFKNKRSLAKRNFGLGEDEAFSNNNNQNINQNINNNQNLNEDFFSGVFGGGGGDEGGCGGGCGEGFGGFGVVPFFPGFIGGFDGGFGGDGIGGAGMNENVNVNEDENNRHNRFGRFGGGGFDGGFDGGFKVKRSPCGAAGYGGYSNCDDISSGNSNININTNNNANQLPVSVYEQAVPYVETVVQTVPYVESVPVVETVYQPTVAYEPYQYVETIPVVQEVYEPVQVIEQVARPVEYYESAQIARPDFYESARPIDFYEPAQAIEQVGRLASFNSFEPIIPQIRAKVIEEKFNIAPAYEQVAPVYEQFAQAVPVIEQPVATVVETVVQPQVEVIQPVEVIAPVAVQIQPVVEYEAVFFEAPSCGVPNYPTYSIPQSCGENEYTGYGGYGGFGGFGGFGGLGGLGGLVGY